MKEQGSYAALALAEADRSACERVVRSVFAAIDDCRATDAVANYADDAVLESARGAATGTAAITNLMAARERRADRLTHHELSETLITAVGADEARFRAILTIYVLSGPTPDQPDGVSDLEVVLARTPEGWRIRHHTSRRRMKGGEA